MITSGESGQITTIAQRLPHQTHTQTYGHFLWGYINHIRDYAHVVCIIE